MVMNEMNREMPDRHRLTPRLPATAVALWNAFSRE